MPRIRYLKPDFFTDEHIADIPFEARLVFQGLWCLADREGRLEDRPKHLKVMILPYDKTDMDKMLDVLSAGDKPFISRYEIDGNKYIQVLNFLKHQKPHHTEKDSNIPVKDKNKEKIKRIGSVHEASTRLDNGSKTVKQPLKQDYDIGFLEFWKQYPNKTGKGKAAESWNKLKPPLDKCLLAIKWQALQASWLKDDGQYIPMPSTWINQSRWEDVPKTHNLVACSKCGVEGILPKSVTGTPLCRKCKEQEIANEER